MGDKPRPKRILILAAMEVEEQAVLKVLPPTAALKLGPSLSSSVKVLRQSDKEIFVLKSGIGLVNAGVATARVADAHSLDGIILLGVAGSLDPDLQIGDMIVANQVVQHDSFFSGDQGNELMAPGDPYVSVDPRLRETPGFETDNFFLSWLRTRTKLHFREGTLLSGSEFVGTPARKLELARRIPEAIAVEMEAAAVAQIARSIGIPFMAVKTIADRLNPDDSVTTDFNRFVEAASENAARLAFEIYRSWILEN